jgi:hypothetical protein
MVSPGTTSARASTIGTPTDLQIRSTDWTPTDAGRLGEAPEAVSETRAGRTTNLTIPARKGRILALDRDTEYHLTAAARLPGATFMLACDPPQQTGRADRGAARPAAESWAYVQFDGPATVTPKNGRIEVRFPESREVRVGVRTTDAYQDAITVPGTTEGMATVLSHSDAAIATDAPGRASPAQRGHPPLVDLGESASVPSEVKRASAHTGVAFHLPASFDELFAAAPLAYYLGAQVTVGEVRQPRLTARGSGFEHVFDDGQFDRSVLDALARVVSLDAMVHEQTATETTAGPTVGDQAPSREVETTVYERETIHREAPDGTTETIVRERSRRGRTPDSPRNSGAPGAGGARNNGGSALVEQLSEGIQNRPLSHRLREYFELPDSTVDGVLPSWADTVEARPRAEAMETLPHLFDALQGVRLPGESERKSTRSGR